MEALPIAPVVEQIQEQQQQLQSSIQSQSNVNSTRPLPVTKPTRELKVEDALLYLDQVKMEFSDKPQIYNEFLDIMKNFKAQSINTPGVIERVKNLFKGYNKLILGFNTFLPEGEGYKIELTQEEQAFHHPGQEVHISNTTTTASSATSSSVTGSTSMDLNNIPTATSYNPNVQSSLSQIGQCVHSSVLGNNSSMLGSNTSGSIPANMPTSVQFANTGMVAPTPVSQPGQMQQAHAIHYVTKIRNRFQNEPDTYRSFLKILHTYQKEQKGIKEVLEQVSQLFSEHPDLLMEFTYFLPDAVQEQAKERLHRAARESEARRYARLQSSMKQSRKGAAPTNISHPPGTFNQIATAQSLSVNQTSGGMMGVGVGDYGTHPISAKRSRAERDARTNIVGQNNVQMAGFDESQQQQYNLAHASQLTKRQQIAQGVASGVSVNANGNPRKVNRKKVALNAGGVDSMGGVGVETDGGKVSAMNQQLQIHLLQQQQQALAHQLQIKQQQQQQQQQQRIKDSHISVSAERKFFDQVKEVLTGSSREAWTEFVKCLELFSSDALSKDDMIELVRDLFGGPQNELFHEFKRLLTSREEYDAHKSDIWYAVPLSEIDFTQCRKCTPSYRALPRDYPVAKCTERSEEERKCLNDQWVSIPIGSEESYSFKHMRKNQYEEALFKCEDERFEIDMVIDSNMSAIRALEPLAEEIMNLKLIEMNPKNISTTVVNTASGIDQPSTSSSMNHASITPRFSFQLEKRHLSTIHLNAIARIYGDHGEEILELLRKNPAGTIPVLLKRLRQKDLEWRKARSELNTKHWREIQEKNHYRSFDHRSFYFRLQDKKYLSTRQLVSEITGQTQSSTSSVATNNAENQPDEANLIGISNIVSPDKEKLLAGMVPQIVMSYKNDAHLIHRDIYQIMCNAVETTVSASNDKERLAALWRDLLRVFFNLPVHYLYPTSPATEVSPDINDADRYKTHPSEAWTSNTKVITMYGRGVVLEFRASDSMYKVQLPFGTAFLSPSSIYGAEQLSANALYVIGVTPADSPNGKDIIFNGLVQSETSAADALWNNSIAEPSKLFYGTQMCYIFMRLHHTLFVRLNIARQLAAQAQKRRSCNVSESGLVLSYIDIQDKEADLIAGSEKPQSIYNHFVGQILALVEGTIDNSKFEDFCRSWLGNSSYVLYTLDKIIAQAVKHLQAMANDENVNRLIGLFLYHRDSPTGSGGVDSILYRNHVSLILSHTMEEVYRIQLMANETGTLSGETVIGVQHLGILTSPSHVVGVTSDNNHNISNTTNTSTSATTSTTTNTLNTRNRNLLIDVTDPVDSSNVIAGLSPRSSSNMIQQPIIVSTKTPKAVVSDDEDDEDHEDEDMDEDVDGNNDEGEMLITGDVMEVQDVSVRPSLYSPSKK